MTCRMMISLSSASPRRMHQRLVTSAIAAVLVLPAVAFGQNRFPTFGLPSSAYGSPSMRTSSGHHGAAPRSLSPAQTNGARLVNARRNPSAVQPVAHEVNAPSSSAQQPSAVQRELQRLYEKNGGEMPPMEIPPGSYQQPPAQQSSTGNHVKRSVVDLMKRQDTRFDTVQTQSSVRPEPTASPQQNPPRTAPAVRPTDGRRDTGGVLSGLFNWGSRSSRTESPKVPPQEPSPYRPPTYRALQAAPQQAPARVKAPAPRPAPARPQTVQRPVTPKPVRSPAPQPPAARTQTANVDSFDLVPLTEPVLAPPAEDDFFPADVVEATPPPKVVPEIKVTPEPKMTAPKTLITPQDVVETIPEVIPQTKNYARELGLASNVEQPAEEIVAQESSPQPAANLPGEDMFGMGNLFPEDEADSVAEEDDGMFELPRTSPQTPEPTAVASDPPESPFTGRKLEAGAFEQPMESPEELVESMPNEPAPFFPSDEHAINSNEDLDISADNLTGQALAPRTNDRVARAVSQRDENTELAGSRMQQIAARDGVGLKGFCPVALRDKRALEDGKAAYISFYHSKAYYFASAEAKATFDNHPELYAPASQGNDVTLMALTGEVLEGSLDHAVWYKDRLYLFSTDENLKTFMAAPSAMAVTE